MAQKTSEILQTIGALVGFLIPYFTVGGYGSGEDNVDERFFFAAFLALPILRVLFNRIGKVSSRLRKWSTKTGLGVFTTAVAYTSSICFFSFGFTATVGNSAFGYVILGAFALVALGEYTSMNTKTRS